MSNIRDFVEGVRYIAKVEAEKAPRDITQRGRVTVANNNLYSVLINGKTYENLTALNGVTFAVNDIVWVTAPQGNFSLMFILGKTS